jgi:pimeloyl-ACP methyl ester carboxylesterase
MVSRFDPVRFRYKESAMPTIVYLPGAGGAATFWQPVAERLADLGPAVRFGWPGFGDEPRDDRIRSLRDLVGWTLARMPPGASDLVAQSMGGVVAALIALEHAERVRRLVLCTTSGGVDVTALGAADWRPGYLAELPHVPDWFVVDRTDVTARLPAIRHPTLVLHGDRDPLCTERVARFIAERIPGAARACIPGGEHMMARDRPDDVAPLIRAHLGAER